MINDHTSHAAHDAALGYFYQVRLALLLSLKKLSNDTAFGIGIEILDDISFTPEDGVSIDVLQTKHHKSRSADLTDLSPDIWKTIRVWSDGILAGVFSGDCIFSLITTSTAATGSVACLLKLDKRDPAAAWSRLHSSMNSSTNVDLLPSFAAFRKLSELQQKTLVNNTYVHDCAPSILDVRTQLRSELYHCVSREHLDYFLEQLEGWWIKVVIERLSGVSPRLIESEHLRHKRDQLRDQFGPQSLPIDDDIISLKIALGPPYSDRRFVKQIETIPAPRNVLFAIQDYHRAVAQRSKWLKHQMILPDDLISYESQLQDAWERRFVSMQNELGESAGEDQMRREALRILAWCEQGSHSPIRPNCTAPFVAIGTYHILADNLKVGWHPNFRERLGHLLSNDTRDEIQ